MNKRLLILYDYFDPAYKAGGPIRSLVNLVRMLEREMEIFVLTTNRDHDGELLEVEPDKWIPYGERSQVKYLSSGNRRYVNLKKTIREIKPGAVYINGMYSLFFVVFPLKVLKRFIDIKVVIAPRGMLQPEALAIKSGKKKIYLNMLKWFILRQDLVWQATTPGEQNDMKDLLGREAQIRLVGNVPSFDHGFSSASMVRNQEKVFGTVALISPMKNIHLVLLAFGNIKSRIEYRIYGPIKDQAYWRECQQIIKALPSNINVNYCGDILPEKVSREIGSFDYYIQPSRSENFGHSIFEAFNNGVPVIISDQTPWRNLVDEKAGWDVALREEVKLVSAIEEAVTMDDQSYLELCHGARRIAENYMNENDFLAQYRALFP